MTNRREKPVWVYTIRDPQDRSCSIRTVELRFFLAGGTSDAADDVADAIRYERSDESVNYHRRRAETLVKETGSTAYYRSSIYGGEFTVRFQTNIPGGDTMSGIGFWYGATIESAKFYHDTVKALAKIAKIAGSDPEPADVCNALKAKPARYLSEVHDYVPDETIIDKLALEAAREEDAA